MDPNANLKEQAEIINVSFPDRTRDQSLRLIELRKALRSWIERGGYPPEWHAHPRAAQYYFRWISAVGIRLPAPTTR